MDTLAGLYAAQPFWFWAAFAAALLAIEVLTGSGWLLWASASAGVTAIVVAVLDISVPTALLVLAMLTASSTLLARWCSRSPAVRAACSSTARSGRPSWMAAISSRRAPRSR